MTGSLERMLLALEPLYKTTFEISIFFSGEEFCDHLNSAEGRFDIVLMDIEMSALTGVEAGRRLREDVAHDLTLLIFVSGHKGYYQEIIDLNVFCFIPKPVSAAEFDLKVGRAIQRVLNQRELSHASVFTIRINKGTVSVSVNSILYLTSHLKQISVHTESKVYTYYGKLNEEEGKLPAMTFCRIHESHLINFAYVETATGTTVVMTNGAEFSVSRRYRNQMKAAYIQYRRGLEPL